MSESLGDELRLGPERDELLVGDSLRREWVNRELVKVMDRDRCERDAVSREGVGAVADAVAVAADRVSDNETLSDGVGREAVLDGDGLDHVPLERDDDGDTLNLEPEPLVDAVIFERENVEEPLPWDSLTSPVIDCVIEDALESVLEPADTVHVSVS